jgi:hypothetical protein
LLKRTLTLAIALSTLYPVATVAETTPVETFTISGVVIHPSDPAWAEFRWQRRHGAPTVKFWEQVAHCETRQDWNNPGRWAGGLGIFTQRKFPEQGMGTWERWGGEQFAPRPDKATPLQQIVVANRIAMFGWEARFRRWDGRAMRVREKHYVKGKTGFNGWGCIKMRRNGSSYGTLNPTRYEQATPRPRITYQVFELTVRLNVPRYAKAKLPEHLTR